MKTHCFTALSGYRNVKKRRKSQAAGICRHRLKTPFQILFLLQYKFDWQMFVNAKHTVVLRSPVAANILRGSSGGILKNGFNLIYVKTGA